MGICWICENKVDHLKIDEQFWVFWTPLVDLNPQNKSFEHSRTSKVNSNQIVWICTHDLSQIQYWLEEYEYLIPAVLNLGYWGNAKVIQFWFGGTNLILRYACTKRLRTPALYHSCNPNYDNIYSEQCFVWLKIRLHTVI